MRVATRALRFAILLMGFSFTVTQGLFLRELLVAFFGNELSIGLILGNWLILEAIGSAVLGRLADRWRARDTAFAALQALFAIMLPLCLHLAYSGRSLAGTSPGEGVGLISILLSSFLIMTPLALVDGAMFAFGCRAYTSLVRQQPDATGRVYALEALGAFVGGVLFTFVFVPHLHALQTALLLSGLNLLSAGLLLRSSPRTPRRTKVAAIAISLVAIPCASLAALSPLAERLQDQANSRLWKGHELVFSRNSGYGNVAVIKQEAQYTFFSDGIPILTAPVPDVALSEEIVHLPMMFLTQPRRALVLSGGLGGVLQELSKYPVAQIDYAELDPLLIETVRRFPTDLTLRETSDPRLNLELVDGAMLIKRKARGISTRPSEGYDLIIVNLPYPATLQLNRFYTQEFFHAARQVLTVDGILVVTMPGSLTYLGDELRTLNAMLQRTLYAAFPHVRPIPGEVTLWLASLSNELAPGSLDEPIARWQALNIETSMVTASHVHLKLDQRRLDWFQESLSGEWPSPPARINRDLQPVGLLYGLSYWNALFSPAMSRAYALLGGLDLSTVSVPILASFLALAAVARLSRKGTKIAIPALIGATGFAGMTADLTVIFAFQVLFGYVYQWMVLLVAVFMVGLAAGSLMTARKLSGGSEGRPSLLKLEMAHILYWIMVPLVLTFLHARMGQQLVITSTQVALPLLNGVAGFLVGAQFPLANELLQQESETTGRSAGFLYAADLAGAFLGSLVVSVVLIPVLGIVQTCYLVLIIKLGSMLVLLASGYRR